MRSPVEIEKRLSANDLGATGSHQAGILVPKAAEYSQFFASLPSGEKNPRVHIAAFAHGGTLWQLNYIYYNSRLFGGTRNEYRLTGLTRYFREVDARAGDVLRFARRDDGAFIMTLHRSEAQETADASCPRLQLSAGWRTVRW